MAKVFLSGWVKKAEVRRGNTLYLRVHEFTWDPTAKEKRRKVWTVVCFQQGYLEPYLGDGSFVSAMGDLELQLGKDGKTYRACVRAELVLGPKWDPRLAGKGPETKTENPKSAGLPEDLTPGFEFYERGAEETGLPEDWVEPED